MVVNYEVPLMSPSPTLEEDTAAKAVGGAQRAQRAGAG